MKNKVTEEQVMFWVGNEGYGHTQRDDMLDTIWRIANGEYPPKVLREDIINTCLSCGFEEEEA